MVDTTLLRSEALGASRSALLIFFLTNKIGMESIAFTVNLREGESCDDVVKRLRQVVEGCEDYLVVREKGTQYGWHWHGAVRCRRKYDAFRKFFVKTMALTSQNGVEKKYCVKRWDNGPEYLRYLCKGPTGAEEEVVDVVMNSGYDTAMYHRQYFEKRAEVLEAHDKKKAAAKRKKVTLRDRFLEFCKESQVDSREDILRCLQEFISACAKEGEKCYVSPGMCVQWCYAAHLVAHPVGASEDLVARVRDMWLR